MTGLLENLWIPLLVLVFALAIAAFYSYRDARASKRTLETLLRSTANTFSTAPDDVRANLFTVTSDGLLDLYSSSDASYGYRPGISIPLASGTAGQAWLQGIPLSSSVTEEEVHTWGLTPRQEQFADPIRSVLAIPLIDSKGRTLGVLTIDSKYPLEKSGLDEEQRIKLAQHVATVITRVISNPKATDAGEPLPKTPSDAEAKSPPSPPSQGAGA